MSLDIIRVDFAREISHNQRRIGFSYMKLSHFLVLSLGLTLGWASANDNTYTGTFWVDGVSKDGGWYDINKSSLEEGQPEENMCYAASAANIIAWWQNSTVGRTLTSNSPKATGDIWQTYVDALDEEYWSEGGDTLAAINWWISGVYFPENKEDTAAWERYFTTPEEWGDAGLDVSLTRTDGYYFDQYGLDNKKLAHFLMDMDQYSRNLTEVDLVELLQGGSAVSLAIVRNDGEDGHALTLWGVEYDKNGKLTSIWITDSDDDIDDSDDIDDINDSDEIDDESRGLCKLPVTVDDGKIWLRDEIYGTAGYYIGGIYAVNARESFKWSALSAEAYVSLKINPMSHNGRAGVTLLTDVFLNEELDSEQVEDDDSDLDDDVDSETEENGALAGLKAVDQDTEGDDEEDSEDEEDTEEDGDDDSEDDATQDTEDDDESESAMEAVIKAMDSGAMNDRDAAALAGASTAVLGQALSGDMDRQLSAIRNRAAMGHCSNDVVALDAKSGSLEQPGRFFAWVNAEGNRAEQNNDGTAAGYTLSSWGGTLGAGMLVDNQLTLGLAVTAMYGDLKSDGPDTLSGDMDTTYLSAFARYQRGSWSHSFIGSVGSMETDYTRHAMHYTNKGDTEGAAFGLMYELGREYALSEERSISPLFNISYRHTVVDSYKERGTDTALNVGKQCLDTVTVALGARYAAVVGQQLLNRACSFEARALAKYDFGDTQSDTTVGIIDTEARASIESAERGAMGLELGAGISMPVCSGSIFADGAVELRSDYTNFNATVGYKIQF